MTSSVSSSLYATFCRNQEADAVFFRSTQENSIPKPRLRRALALVQPSSVSNIVNIDENEKTVPLFESAKRYLNERYPGNPAIRLAVYLEGSGLGSNKNKTNKALDVYLAAILSDILDVDACEDLCESYPSSDKAIKDLFSPLASLFNKGGRSILTLFAMEFKKNNGFEVHSCKQQLDRLIAENEAAGEDERLAWVLCDCDSQRISYLISKEDLFTLEILLPLMLQRPGLSIAVFKKLCRVLFLRIVYRSESFSLCLPEKKHLLALVLKVLKNIREAASPAFQEAISEQLQLFQGMYLLKLDHIMQPQLVRNNLQGGHVSPCKGERAMNFSDGYVQVKSPMIRNESGSLSSGFYSGSVLVKSGEEYSVKTLSKFSSFFPEGIDETELLEAINYVIRHPLNRPAITGLGREYVGRFFRQDHSVIDMIIWTKTQVVDGEQISSIETAYPSFLRDMNNEEESTNYSNLQAVAVDNAHVASTIIAPASPLKVITGKIADLSPVKIKTRYKDGRSEILKRKMEKFFEKNPQFENMQVPERSSYYLIKSPFEEVVGNITYMFQQAIKEIKRHGEDDNCLEDREISMSISKVEDSLAMYLVWQRSSFESFF